MKKTEQEYGEEIIIFQKDKKEDVCQKFLEGYESQTAVEIEKEDWLKENLSEEKKYLTLLFCKETENKEKPILLFLAESQVKEKGLVVSVLYKISRQEIVGNLRECLEIADFPQKEGGYVEHSREIKRYLEVLIQPPFMFRNFQKTAYEPLEAEQYQHPLSQKNEYCERIYEQSGIGGRGEFQRDYDRIIHSKAFRRLVDKAQIFSAEKGDYYRTRMTHTLTVVQIAKGISNPLKLNLYLTEAIAMGHDLGHTPFGHQGERTLDAILKGKIKILPEEECEKNFYGGFKHNYQTLREVTRLEETYVKYDGLNLSFQTLEGMWKHTRIKEEFSLSEFFPEEFLDRLYPDMEFSSCLEGQVAAIADEIAQRGHDLDDAFAAGLITLDDLEHYLELNQMRDLLKILRGNRVELETYKKENRMFADEEGVLINRAVSEVIRYFIEDVISHSTARMEDYSIEDFEKNNHRVCEKVIGFSEKGTALCRYLEKIISKKVINCSEVTLFDTNASKIVESLFRVYYNNPGLLHDGTLMRIYRDFREKTIHVLDFRNSDPKILKEEWRKITCPEVVEESLQDEYKAKRKILVRNICDFIAGMTDSYAKKEYQRIYL